MITLDFSNLSPYSKRKLLLLYEEGVLGEFLEECIKQRAPSLVIVWRQTERGHDFWNNIFFSSERLKDSNVRSTNDRL